MIEERINVFSCNINKKIGLDVEILSDEATIADYCNAMDNFILNNEFSRLRSSTNECEGCDICCKERIPLTIIDVKRLKMRLDDNLSMEDFLRRYTYVIVNSNIVDITLVIGENGRCMFLNEQLKKCCYYVDRPFVCRTYVCAEISARANKLRNYILNSGEDELMFLWQDLYEKGICIVHETLDFSFEPNKYVRNAWTGAESYEDIVLKDILPTSLWQKLRKGDSIV